jgi:DNA-binding beta-propeller fold protein YncE
MARSVNGLAGIRSPVLLPIFAGAQPLAAPNVIGDGGAAASTASAAWPGGRQDGIGGKRHPLGARPRDRPRDPPPRQDVFSSGPGRMEEGSCDAHMYHGALGAAAAAGALISLGLAGAAGAASTATQARPTHPATAYAVSGSDTVTPILTATNKAGKAIKVGSGPDAIAITPDEKTAYVTSGSGVTPISTATNKAGKAIKVGNGPDAIAITQ